MSKQKKTLIFYCGIKDKNIFREAKNNEYLLTTENPRNGNKDFS